MNSYKVGKCPQCNDKIMVRDAAGRWTSPKPNFRQMDLMFGNGQKVRTIICSVCAEAPDYTKLMGAILHKDSKACTEKWKQRIKYIDVKNKIERGLPVSHQIK